MVQIRPKPDLVYGVAFDPVAFSNLFVVTSQAIKKIYGRTF